MSVSFTTYRLQWRKSVKRWSVLSQVLAWSLAPLEGFWKQQSQSQAAQTGDDFEPEHIDAKPPTSEKPESENQNPDF